MNKSKLLEIINKAIDEILEEGTMVTDSNGRTTYVDNEDPSISNDPNIKSATTTSGKKLKEAELDEAAKYSVGDESKVAAYISTLVGKKKERVPLIIQAIKDSPNGYLTGGKIAAELPGVNGQPQIYSLLLDLEKEGILTAADMVKINRPTSTNKIKSTTQPIKHDDTEELPSEEINDDDNDEGDGTEYAGDETDLFVGGGNPEKIFSKYFEEPEGEHENKPEPIIKPNRTLPSPTTTSAKAGEWFYKNSKLIQALINKAKTKSTRIGKLKEDINDIGGGDFKKTTQASINWANESYEKLLQELANELQIVKDTDHNLYIKLLNDLERYKFGATNTLRAFNDLLRKLNEKGIPSAKQEPEEEIDIDDDEDIIDNEDEDEDTLDEVILNRFRKIANIK